MGESHPPERAALEWGMVGLAVVSVSLLLAPYVAPLSPSQGALLRGADLAILGVFWAEFLVRLRGAAGQRTRFLLTRGSDLVGMVPVAHPALRAFLLLRAARLLSIPPRALRALNRAYGEEHVAFHRFKEALVHEVSDHVTLRILSMAQRWFTHVKLTEAFRRALEENRSELVWMEREILRTSPRLRPLVTMPGYSAATNFASETVTDILIRTLSSERMNRILAQVVNDIFEEMKREVARPEPLRPGEEGPSRR